MKNTLLLLLSFYLSTFAAVNFDPFRSEKFGESSKADYYEQTLFVEPDSVLVQSNYNWFEPFHGDTLFNSKVKKDGYFTTTKKHYTMVFDTLANDSAVEEMFRKTNKANDQDAVTFIKIIYYNADNDLINKEVFYGYNEHGWITSKFSTRDLDHRYFYDDDTQFYTMSIIQTGNSFFNDTTHHRYKMNGSWVVNDTVIQKTKNSDGWVYTVTQYDISSSERTITKSYITESGLDALKYDCDILYYSGSITKTQKHHYNREIISYYNDSVLIHTEFDTFNPDLLPDARRFFAKATKRNLAARFRELYDGMKFPPDNSFAIVRDIMTDLEIKEEEITYSRQDSANDATEWSDYQIEVKPIEKPVSINNITTKSTQHLLVTQTEHSISLNNLTPVDVKVSLISATGRVILNKVIEPVNSLVTIPTTNFAAGVYFLTAKSIHNGSVIQTAKLSF